MSDLEIAWAKALRRRERAHAMTFFVTGMTTTVIVIACANMALHQMAMRDDTDIRTLVGTSMEPTQYEDDLIICDTTVTVDDLAVGDIICFERGDESICHRVVDKGTEDDREFVRTKGDNNESMDSDVIFDEELSNRVVMRIPGLAPFYKMGLMNMLDACSVSLVLTIACLAYVLRAQQTVDELYPTWTRFSSARACAVQFLKNEVFEV